MGQAISDKQRYNLRRELLINAGRWQPYVDAEPARRHVNELRAGGIGPIRIAQLAGVSKHVVQRLLYGHPHKGQAPTRRIRPDIAVALLAVRPGLDVLADGAHIDATGTRRRSHALVCLGWSQGEQARRLGVEHRTYAGINGRAHVTVATARAVRSLYDELSMTPAPHGQGANYARNLAKRRGYAPPLAWDDDTIDDPAAQPDLGKQVTGPAAHLENADWLIGQGYTLAQAAERLGLARDYLLEMRRRETRKQGLAA